MSRLHRGLAATVVCALGAAAVIAIPSTVLAAENGVRINEVESNGGTPGDWVEFYNPTDAPVVLDGYVFKDNEDGRTFAIPSGTTIAAGGYYVLDEKGGVGNFDFGLGANDSARLYDTAAQLVDERSWTGHATTTYGVRDGATPDWQLTSGSTKGAPNTFPTTEPEPEPTDSGSIRINEVDSGPADSVEFYNPGTTALDISGYEIRDNSNDHRWSFVPGTSIGAGQYLVVEATTVGVVDGANKPFSDPIGIGSADRIRLFDRAGALIDETHDWTAHASIDGSEAAAWLARCPDGVGAFRLAYATKGATNSCVQPKVAINEIESNGDATDWVEIVNLETAPIDISGWTLMDSDPSGHAAETTPLPAGTTVAAGGYFVFDGGTNFTFGLGGGDTVTVRDASGVRVVEHVYPAHAQGTWARCPDGTGEFRDAAESTKGLRNACGNPVRINEVESDGGSPDDWIELVNPTAAALDVSGIVVKDSDDTNSYAIPAGTSIAANGYLALERATLGFGLSGTDAVRLFEGTEVIDRTSWTAHADTTWGRCPDASGAFGDTYSSTKGAANVCEAPALAWPGAAETQVLDPTPTFLEDSSGLDTQVTANGNFLWAVDNGTGTFWKLAIAADGSVSPAAGWKDGKQARFQKDAVNGEADGPDAEGITVAGDGYVYLASERDNSNSGVNQNVVLKIDPNAPGPDVVSTQEWDLTAKLPNVSANVGLEAVEWVSDTNLVGALVDTNTGALYQPTRYPGHGGGLFFVAVEDNGHIYAFALNADGSSMLVSEIVPGLTAVMALDYDTELDVLWAVCDNGCDTAAEQITLNGTATPGIVRIARPAGLPNLNNEGFATLPSTLVDGGSTRPAWWFADGELSGALRLGSLPYTADPTDPTDPDPTASPTTEPTTEPTIEPATEPSPNPTITSGPSPIPSTGGGSGEPLPGDMLDASNRGDVTVPASAAAGSSITVSAGAQYAGTDVQVWMYSTPVRLTTGTLDAAGRITVTLPADAVPGMHRIAVFTAEGPLLGWASIQITRAAAGLAATGSESLTGILWLGGLLIAAGVLVVVARRRGVRAER